MSHQVKENSLSYQCQTW